MINNKRSDGSWIPSVYVVEGTLILVQVLFGIGSIVGKLGIKTFNPVLFALIREGTAGPILLLLSFVKIASLRRKKRQNDRDLGGALANLIESKIDGEGEDREHIVPFVPYRRDFFSFLVCGFFIFANQLGFIMGEKLANATIGSAWQPTQPIMTAAAAMIIGWERPTLLKIGGIVVAAGGAAFMVFYKSNSSVGSNPIVGNVLFIVNCAGTAGYVIVSKRLLKSKRYVAIVVTAWSYICASIFMIITGIAVNASEKAVRFVCPPNDGEDEASCSAWGVPTSAIGPLIYWIFVQSVLCYMMLTWANQYAKPSSVVAYTALQPMTSALLSVFIVKIFGKVGGIVMPGLNLLGGIAIVVGLFMIIYDTSKQKEIEDALVVLHRDDPAAEDTAAGDEVTDF